MKKALQFAWKWFKIIVSHLVVGIYALLGIAFWVLVIWFLIQHPTIFLVVGCFVLFFAGATGIAMLIDWSSKSVDEFWNEKDKEKDKNKNARP